MAWDTDDSSGLLQHYIGTVKSSVWTTDSTKQDPNAPFLQWEVSVDDVLQSNYEGTVPETVLVNLTIGKGWVEDEKGETVEHKDGTEVFKASSTYGKIIDLVAGKSESYGSNAVVKDGDGDYKADFKAVSKYMQANGFDDPRVAAIWNGLTFEFRGIGFKYRGQDEVYSLTLPVRLVGEGEATATPAPAKASKAKSKSEPIDTVPVWLEAGADDATAQTLNDLANSASSHTEFARNALLLDNVKGTDSLRDAVMDTANFPS